jgi:hypothetical protein
LCQGAEESEVEDEKEKDLQSAKRETYLQQDYPMDSIVGMVVAYAYYNTPEATTASRATHVYLFSFLYKMCIMFFCFIKMA